MFPFKSGPNSEEFVSFFKLQTVLNNIFDGLLCIYSYLLKSGYSLSHLHHFQSVFKHFVDLDSMREKNKGTPTHPIECYCSLLIVMLKEIFFCSAFILY